MEFLRPGLLWGLLAVALPILIHLLGRRRVRTVPIATLRFLERARVRASAYLRLRRLLLLLARMAALGCLALLYAGPGCAVRGADQGQVAYVLVLDNSPSMAARRGGRTRLEEAQAAFRGILADAEPGDRFLVMTTGAVDQGLASGFAADVSGVREVVEDVALQFGPHSVDRALEAAVALAEGQERGRVVLATDLQATGWASGQLPGMDRVPLQIVDVGFPDPMNTWVATAVEDQGSLRVSLGAMGAADPVRRTVRVSTGEGEDVTAFLEGLTASFQLRDGSERRSGVVRVEPGGDLDLDDALPFTERGAGQVGVLLVNGDPRGFEIRDELLFVRRALDSEARLGELFAVREVRQGEFLPADLAGVDVAVLANPGPLEPQPVEALRKGLEQGLGLIVTAGDRWGADQQGLGGLEGLLAAPVRDAVLVPADDPSRPPFEVFDLHSFSGPMAIFRDPVAGDLAGARVRMFWALDLGAGSGVRTWMSLETGAPLLVERKVGRGTTLVFGTTVDRDGADFCLQPGFVPWLERLLLHAAGRLRPALERSVLAGAPLTLPYEEAVAVEQPDGTRAFWKPGGEPFRPPRPGVYRILREGEEIDAFVARLAPEESDLTRLTMAALNDRLGEGRFALGSADEPLAASVSGRRRRDLSATIAAAILAVLALEAVLSARGIRRRRAPILEEG